eukprot:9218496-Pyramimonas_sp.AAC.1
MGKRKRREEKRNRIIKAPDGRRSHCPPRARPWGGSFMGVASGMELIFWRRTSQLMAARLPGDTAVDDD